MSDPLDALRAAVGPTGDLTNVSLLSEDGSTVEDVQQAERVRIQLPSDGRDITFLKSQPTRMSATLASAQDGTAALKPGGLLPLDALIFALKTKDESSGTYTRLRTVARVARIELVYRTEILSYLTGKRDSWEGVISPDKLLPESQEPVGSDGRQNKEAVVDGPTPAPGSSQSETGAANATPSGEPPARSADVSTKRSYVPDKGDAELAKKLRSDVEVVPRNRNDAAHGTEYWAQTGDFSHFRLTIEGRLNAMRKLVTGRGSAAQDSHPAPVSARPPPPGLARRQRAQDPVILLSNSPTALVNMFNVKQLLEDGVFIHPKQARLEARGVAETVVSLNHTMSFARASIPGQAPKPTRFLVVDNVDALNKLSGPSRGESGGNDPWARVAAIFTTGQTWQFKQYKEQDPKKLFQKFPGFYVRYHNENRQENIPLWHVRELVVDANQRHTDKQVSASFWRMIEHNMKMRHS